MKTLAALHNPDMVAGGKDDLNKITIGDKQVNSSIGGSWKGNRVQGIDAAATKLPRIDRNSMKMNVKLERCK